MHISGILNTGSPLVGVLLTLLAAVPCSVWCPQPRSCIQKNLWWYSPATSSCLLCFHTYLPYVFPRLTSPTVFIQNLFPVFDHTFCPFLSLLYFFTLFAGKQDQNCTQFSKKSYGTVQVSLYFWSNLDSEPLLLTMLMHIFTLLLFLCPSLYWWELIKFALLPRYLSQRAEKELLGFWHSTGVLMSVIA